jgi:hypothetical protein
MVHGVDSNQCKSDFGLFASHHLVLVHSPVTKSGSHVLSLFCAVSFETSRLGGRVFDEELATFVQKMAS